MTNLINDIWLVEIPDVKVYQYVLFQIPGTSLSWLHFLDEQQNDVYRSLEVDCGQWSLIGISDEITEEQAAMIVEGDRQGYDGYVEYERDGNFCNQYAVNSFRSLLRSKQLSGRYSILKKL